MKPVLCQIVVGEALDKLRVGCVVFLVATGMADGGFRVGGRRFQGGRGFRLGAVSVTDVIVGRSPHRRNSVFRSVLFLNFAERSLEDHSAYSVRQLLIMDIYPQTFPLALFALEYLKELS